VRKAPQARALHAIYLVRTGLRPSQSLMAAWQRVNAIIRMPDVRHVTVPGRPRAKKTSPPATWSEIHVARLVASAQHLRLYILCRLESKQAKLWAGALRAFTRRRR
jgi:hypothetical protein